MADKFGTVVLPALDTVRGVGGLLGIRPFSVTVRRRVWSGVRPGVGTKVDTDVVLTNFVQGSTDIGGGPYPVRVRQVSRKEIIASGGQYTDRDIKVGPMTPAFAATAFGPAGGFDDTSIDPAPTSQAVEIIWIVSTPNGTFGIPDSGAIFEKIGEEATALHYIAYLRQTGRSPS